MSHPKFVPMPTPAALTFEVPLTDEGASAKCPRCGFWCVCHWGKEHLEWWLHVNSCIHFTGVYESGRLGTVEAKFR